MENIECKYVKNTYLTAHICLICTVPIVGSQFEIRKLFSVLAFPVVSNKVHQSYDNSEYILSKPRCIARNDL